MLALGDKAFRLWISISYKLYLKMQTEIAKDENGYCKIEFYTTYYITGFCE